MGEKLDFSLPEKKPKGSVAGVLTVLLLVVLVALAAANLVMVLPGSKGIASESSGGLTAGQLKELAGKLSQRDLHQQAADAWQDYLASADLDDSGRAKVLFQTGLSLEKAGQYGSAIEYYYRSELTAQLDDLNSQINPHIRQCYEKLGAFSALRYELMDRTSMTSAEPAGGKIVAEIGAEKFTEADLDEIIERSIENQLAPMAPYLSPEQLGQQKKRLLEQVRDPKAKIELLQAWVNSEVLYRQALEEGLAETPETKRVLEDLTRSVLSQKLMNGQLASRINVTAADQQTYYTANKQKYIDPVRATISHILLADEDQAAAVLERVAAGEDFAALAKEFSVDEQTKGAGGKIAEPVLEGASVPGIGEAAQINTAIFAAKAPAVLKQAFKTEKGWEIVKVDRKDPERQKLFDEVRQQVKQELLGQKRQEVERDYIESMRNKHNVIVHTSVFAPTEAGAAEDTPSNK